MQDPAGDENLEKRLAGLGARITERQLVEAQRAAILAGKPPPPPRQLPPLDPAYHTPVRLNWEERVAAWLIMFAVIMFLIWLGPG